MKNVSEDLGERRPQSALLRRQIAPHDLEDVVNLLRVGFPRRSLGYWQSALRYLGERTISADYPRFGYALVTQNRVVGVLLLIFADDFVRERGWLRCNLSSWYVIPEYQHLAPLLVQPALQFKNTTLINTSPALNTLPIVVAQGFQRFCEGTFLSFPALGKRIPGVTVLRIRHSSVPLGLLPPKETRVLADHDARGCISIIVRSNGEFHPFVFRRKFVRYHLRFGWLPCAQLVYARDLESLAWHARPIGRYLASCGAPLLLIGANGPVAGLAGKYFQNKNPMYYRGPERPRLGDLAYTEAALFGA